MIFRKHTIGGTISASSEMEIIHGDWTAKSSPLPQSPTSVSSSNSSTVWKRRSNAKIVDSATIERINNNRISGCGAFSDGDYSFQQKYTVDDEQYESDQINFTQYKPRPLKSLNSTSNALSYNTSYELPLNEKNYRNSLTVYSPLETNDNHLKNNNKYQNRNKRNAELPGTILHKRFTLNFFLIFEYIVNS